MCGFSDQAHLTRVMRLRLGTTPGQLKGSCAERLTAARFTLAVRSTRTGQSGSTPLKQQLQSCLIVNQIHVSRLCAQRNKRLIGVRAVPVI